MAIVLNSNNKQANYSKSSRAYRASVVPAASVWDADASARYGASRSPHVRDVRTLSVDNRTYNGVSQRRPRADHAGQHEVANSRENSNRGNYLLGAVFGVAVFVGTVFGGLTADGGAAPQGTQQVVQASVNN